MRRSRFLAVALFLVGAVAVIEAQQPRPGGGRGGFRLEVITAVVDNPDLQAELKVTDAQKEKLKSINEKQDEATKKLFEGFKGGKGGKGFDKDAFAEIREKSAKVREDSRKAIEEVLTADQKKRIKEIQLQVDGIRAFDEEEVAAQLNLNESQKSKIKGISDDYTKDIGELFGRGKGGGGFDKEKASENAKKREKLSKAAMADIEDVLTDEQRSKWKTMVGAPFDTSKLNRFGGRGFGGGGGTFGKGKGRPKD